jgi:hypothetical protein
MGEAKRKRSQTQKFLESHPYCCFCGGNEPATTRDHVPSRQVFARKQRPAGLEVPACKRCNNGTSRYEQVAAMLSRLYPDPVETLEKNEIDHIMNAVNRNQPLLFGELVPSWRQQYDFKQSQHLLPSGTNPINASGPLLNQAIQIFSVKLCLALHYEKTGRIVPNDGGIAVRWFSNHEGFTNQLPEEIFTLFQNQATLQQGKWEVRDQFGYSWAFTTDGTSAAYFAYFRNSFAIVGFVRDDRSSFPSVEGMTVYSPGSFFDC